MAYSMLTQSAATDKRFRERVQEQLVAVAREKQAEARKVNGRASDGLADRMVREPQRFTWTYAHAICVVNAALTLASANEDIRNTILEVWNILAQ